MNTVLFTLAEDTSQTTPTRFAVKYSVDEEDCFAFADGLARRGYRILFVNWDDYDQESSSFTRMFSYSDSAFITPVPLTDITLSFIYKQEGFLRNTPRFYSMIDAFNDAGAIVINEPTTIRNNISKDYLFELAREGIRTIPTYHIAPELLAGVSPHTPLIIKPKISERGKDQSLITSPDHLTLPPSEYENYIAQDFIMDIRGGEKSLVFFGKQYSHAILKLPNPTDPNEYRTNESAGGKVFVYDPSTEELAYARNVLDTWEAIYGSKVHFSRIDFLTSNGEPMLVEAELLNPSIFANYSRKGEEIGERLADYFDRVIKGEILAYYPLTQ